MEVSEVMRRMKVLSLVLVFAMVFSFAVSFDNVALAKSTVWIYTGSGPGSVYFAIGSMLAKVINKKSDKISARGVTSGASVANCRAIGKGEAQVAIAQNDVTYYAWNGIAQFKGKPVKDLRGIATLYPEPVQLVVKANSNIKTLKDLAGKKVVVGAAGSGTAQTAEKVLKAAGVWDKVDRIYQTFSEAAQSLVLGQIDANFTVIAFPAPAVNQIAVRVPVRLIPIPDDIVKKLHDEGYPFYVKVVIPKGTYNGMEEDTQTIAVKSTLIIDKDVPDDVAYEITKVLFENIDDLAKAHQVAKQINIKGAFEGLMVPLHPGAIKYYEEKGIKVPDNLKP